MPRKRTWPSGVWGVFAMLVVAAACTTSSRGPAAGLELFITTNLTYPDQYDAVQVEVKQQLPDGTWRKVFNVPQKVPGDVKLPTHLAIAPGTSPDQDALIQVTALRGFSGIGTGTPAVVAVAQVQIPTDRVAVLTLELSTTCIGVFCTGKKNESCQPSDGRCASDIITDPARTLPTYEPDASYVDVGDASDAPPSFDGTVHDAKTPAEARAESGISDANARDNKAPETGSEGGTTHLYTDFPVAPVNDPLAPVAGLTSLFSGDGGVTTGGPCLSEPADGSLYPYNWQRPRVFWTAPGGQNAFEVRLSAPGEMNDYVVYTTNNYWVMDLPTWQKIAGVQGGAKGTLIGQPISVIVRGTNTTSGGTPAISNTASFEIAPAIADGSLIYLTLPSAASSTTTLQGFRVGDEGSAVVLTTSQVQQEVVATIPDGGSLPGPSISERVGCIGCHAATPDGNYVGFTAQWPWPNAFASISADAGALGSIPPWLTTGAIANLSPNNAYGFGGDYNYLGGENAQLRNNVDDVMLGTQSFSKAHYTAGDRVEIAQLGDSLDDPESSSGTPEPLQPACQVLDGGVGGEYPTPCSSVVVSQLAWFNLEWTGKPDAGSPPTAAPGAPQNGGWGILSRTGDETNSAGTPDWSHDGLTIAYTSTSPLVGTRDGRLQGPAEGGVGGAGVPVLGTSADIKTIPYTASASVGGAGGPATGLTGASDPSYNEYYPAFSPDDKLLAFNRVPYTASMYNQPLTQVYLVPFNQGDGGPPVRLVANDPVSCTGLASPGVQNTWPKWAPNPQTIDGKTYYWVSFFSTRSVAAGATPGAAGLMQLFVAGVVVDNATGNVITFAPIYPWNQDGTVDNLMAVWGDFSLPAGTTPPPSPICDGGSCVPGCVIDGLFYASGATTGDGCQICQPETNLTAWTNVSGAGSCRAGDVCNAGSCSPGCSVDGTFYPSGATANNGCEICQPGTSTTALVDVTGAARCPQGEVCSAGSCTPGCSIGGVFYGSGDVAVDDCEMCEPTTSATTWTDVSGGNCLLPKSCNQTGPGMTTCPGGSGTDSCCSSLEVTAAAQRLTQFYRTYLSSGTVTFDEADPATVSNFRLDEYLVTVGRFRQFVNAVLPPDSGTGWMPAPGSGKQTLLNRGSGLLNSATELPDSGPESYEMGWESDWSVDIDPTDQNLECSPNSTWTDPVSTQESLPINCVNWYEAYAFCIWDGGFLPSEAEWEFAAAGGILQREYPWGSAAPGTTNQYAIYGGYYAGNSIGIARVGSSAMGVGYWGQLDLAGELGEWTLDGYAAYVDPCVDCAYLPMAATARVVRGGNFLSATTELSPATRLEYGPLVRRSDVGVRCARSL